jgi:hypothetical protein
VRGRCLRALVAVPGFIAAVLQNTIEYATETRIDYLSDCLEKYANLRMSTSCPRVVGMKDHGAIRPGEARKAAQNGAKTFVT